MNIWCTYKAFCPDSAEYKWISTGKDSDGKETGYWQKVRDYTPDEMRDHAVGSARIVLVCNSCIGSLAGIAQIVWTVITCAAFFTLELGLVFRFNYPNYKLSLFMIL